MTEITVEITGGEQLVYLPCGMEPEPLYVSQGDDLNVLLEGDPRNRMMLITLLRLALRNLTFDKADCPCCGGAL